MTPVLPAKDKRRGGAPGNHGKDGAGANGVPPGSAIVDLLVREGKYTSGPGVLSELRRVIASGEVPAGDSISVDDVAAFFGVSRIPVREALKTLTGEGLVEQHWRGGYTVTDPTPAELVELYLVRGLLLGAASRVAAGKASRADHERARAAHARLVETGAGTGAAAFHQNSREFHASLVGPCRMPHLLRMLDIAWNLTPPVRTKAWRSSQGRAAVLKDHETMLAAFVSGDGEGLARVIEELHERLARLGTHAGRSPSSKENRCRPE